MPLGVILRICVGLADGEVGTVRSFNQNPQRGELEHAVRDDMYGKPRIAELEEGICVCVSACIRLSPTRARHDCCDNCLCSLTHLRITLLRRGSCPIFCHLALRQFVRPRRRLRCSCRPYLRTACRITVGCAVAEGGVFIPHCRPPVMEST